MLLKRAMIDTPKPANLAAIPGFIMDAAMSPWIYGSLTLQVLGYFLWMLLVSHEKLGIATASVGAGFYILMAFAAWAAYGETLNGVQWLGIVLITVGVVCVSWAKV
jgi:small multidrug resistance pump/undecaprenyl phosphate-alpha-L-ara4N flippase subunit ArnE